MIRGIYASAAGMIAESKKIDVIGNNVSNMGTPGFKSDSVTLGTFGDELLRMMNDNVPVGNLPYGVTITAENTNLTEGSFKNTGDSTDLAIKGNGFFAVQDAAGAVKYTRDGDFQVDAQGYLATSDGSRLLGANGPLYVSGNRFSVASDGTVTTQDGRTERISLYDGQAQKRADGYFNVANPGAATGMLMQGYQELSNSDAVTEMTELMSSTRAFQGCQEAMSTINSTLDKLVNNIGSLKA